MTTPKIELGHRLFYDTRLSGNGTYACASCHDQARAFTDGRAQALGATGELHPRGAMSLTNVAYNLSFGWYDPGLRSLENQAAVPMFNEHPVELGVKGYEAEVLARFATAIDTAQFAAAFPGAATVVSLTLIEKAIAAFERTLLSGNSPFDRFLYRDDRAALSDSARRGMDIFFSKRTKCSECHSGFNLSGPTQIEGTEPEAPVFHQTGVGQFRAPTLRNIAVTAPYMHDGRLPSLEAVVAHYARGGDPVSRGQKKSDRLRGFRISAQESADLVEFMKSLTDTDFLASAAARVPAKSERR